MLDGGMVWEYGDRKYKRYFRNSESNSLIRVEGWRGLIVGDEVYEVVEIKMWWCKVEEFLILFFRY